MSQVYSPKIIRMKYGTPWHSNPNLLFDYIEYERLLHNGLQGRNEFGEVTEGGIYIPKRRNRSFRNADKDFQNFTDYPTVYLVYFKANEQLEKLFGGTVFRKRRGGKPRYIAYVGETNQIIRRTQEHLTIGRSREFEDFQPDDIDVDSILQRAVAHGAEVSQYVIWHEFFTKSMTLDIENQLIDYLNAIDSVEVLNGRRNQQGNYYKAAERPAIFSTIWRMLSQDNIDLFPPEAAIWNSQFYKSSPFHLLGAEQRRAVEEIVGVIQSQTEVYGSLSLTSRKPLKAEAPLLQADAYLGQEVKDGKSHLILLRGTAGTGKSIVISTLFADLLQETSNKDDSFAASKVALIVNNDQQKTLYEDMAKRLPYAGRSQLVYKATSFCNTFLPLDEAESTNNPDIVLIDEAHLLLTTGNRSYGNKFLHNQLLDILLRTKVVVAVFDPSQVMRNSQWWEESMIKAMLPDDERSQYGGLSESYRITLTGYRDDKTVSYSFLTQKATLSQQFRMQADEATLRWIERLTDTEVSGMEPIPAGARAENKDTEEVQGYEIRVFESPHGMMRALKEKSTAIKSLFQNTAVANRKAGSSKNLHDYMKPSPLCRAVATYDWPYSPKDEGVVELYRVKNDSGEWGWVSVTDGAAPKGYNGSKDNHFRKKWNTHKSIENKVDVWSANPDAEDEIGSYFTIQGFDLNYVGVIIGPSVTYRDGRIVFDRTKSCDPQKIQARNTPGARDLSCDALIRNELGILLKRGVKGLYLFAADQELQSALTEVARASGCFVEDCCKR